VDRLDTPGRKVTCELYSHSSSAHLDQIYTGFASLHRQGIIDLRQRVISGSTPTPSQPQHLRDARHAHLNVVVNDRVRVHYDTHDSWEIDEEFLRGADYYYKRSFAAERLLQYGAASRRIHPLGLNYPVFSDGIDRFALERAWKLERNRMRKLKGLVSSTGLFDQFLPVLRVKSTQFLPAVDAAPRILFMARAWDPENDPGRSKEKVEERAQINEIRASCVRLLRREFGAAFFGGFARSDYATKHYKDVLLPEKGVASRGKYLDRLRSYPICIATTGLHGSIGWKLAEYVSFAKAIVSEKLCYEVPGGFRSGLNFLEFSSPDDCVEKSLELHANKDLRVQMMLRNAAYYHSELRPDLLVLKTILRALSESA
jgi:hypothetical protein